MNKTLLDILVCPVTKGTLTLNQDGTELISKIGGMAYPVRDGIPVLLEIVSLKVCLVSKETSFLILNSILDSETLLIIS